MTAAEEYREAEAEQVRRDARFAYLEELADTREAAEAAAAGEF